jgi:hypothetical protein
MLALVEIIALENKTARPALIHRGPTDEFANRTRSREASA